jgi:hypothetical protein
MNNERKWQFWIGPYGLMWGDRSTGQAHTQIGFVWVFLAGWGVYAILKHL